MRLSNSAIRWLQSRCRTGLGGTTIRCDLGLSARAQPGHEASRSRSCKLKKPAVAAQSHRRNIAHRGAARLRPIGRDLQLPHAPP